ncbi:hypothetical protein HC891_19625 [Candidatus Gracilibacteria bacterium]|nr:hypothetical protein [Candidatus Gracilibacteria bacterium]
MDESFFFQLIDPASDIPNSVGPWAAQPAPPEIAFAAESDMLPVPVWRATFADDRLEAHEAIAAAEAILHADRGALAITPHRLDALRQSQTSGPSFGSAADTALPEQGLLALLGAAELRASGVSFGSANDEAMPDEARGAFAQVQALTAQVVQTISNFAVVETVVAGRKLGRTTVSWTGQVSTVLAVGVLPNQVVLHRRTLRLALQSRLTLLHTFATVTRGASIVVTLAVSPLGALLALPAAWRFVTDLFQEQRFQRYSGGQNRGAGLCTAGCDRLSSRRCLRRSMATLLWRNRPALRCKLPSPSISLPCNL